VRHVRCLIATNRGTGHADCPRPHTGILDHTRPGRFLDSPPLTLTLLEAQQRFGLDRRICEAVLDLLDRREGPYPDAARCLRQVLPEPARCAECCVNRTTLFWSSVAPTYATAIVAIVTCSPAGRGRTEHLHVKDPGHRGYWVFSAPTPRVTPTREIRHNRRCEIVRDTQENHAPTISAQANFRTTHC
jgi:hypothetical protein